jgi:hypothetical protein
MYHSLYVKVQRFRKALQKKIQYNFPLEITTPGRFIIRNKLFPFSSGGVESKKYECPRVGKIQNEYNTD